MVATPALVSLVRAGGAGHLPMLQSILEIALKLLAPFLAGHLLRPWIEPLVTRWKPWISKLDRAVITLIVYTAFCQSTKDGVWSRFSLQTLLEVFVLVAVLLGAVLTLTRLLSRQLGFSTEDEITAIFCGSKKSLANGAPIAKILFGASPALGAILLPLMIYHQLQLIVCSFVAKRYATRLTVSPPSPPRVSSSKPAKELPVKGVRLDHATINTHDVAASVSFYEHYLGLKPGWRPGWDIGGAWLYAVDGDYPILHLLEQPRSTGVSMFNHVAFRGEDLQAYLSKLKADGCWFEARPVDETPYTQVHHFDPNDVRIEVIFEEPLGCALLSSDDLGVKAVGRAIVV